MKLYGNPGWGSAIVEAQLVHYGLPFEYVNVGDLFASADARAALSKVNPIAQVPTLVLDDGTVMSESAAITLLLADRTDRDDLVPEPDTPERASFLRWLIFIVANIYPTYTYADDPSRFVSVEAAQGPFRDSVNDYAKRLYTILNGAAGAPWFLGHRLSALDIYVGVMTHWRPKTEWFAANTPALTAIRTRVKDLEALKPVWARNFPDK